MPHVANYRLEVGMIEIKKNNITVTKGDSLPLHITCMDGDRAYTPIEGDSIRFALSKGYKGEKGYVLILSKNVPLDTYDITISATETGNLEYITYNYDVELTHANGIVDTFISGTLEITGECK